MAKKPAGKGIGLTADICMPGRMTPQQRAAEQRYRAEDDLRTLRRAEEVRSDPARVRMAQKIAAEEMKALAKVAKK